MAVLACAAIVATLLPPAPAHAAPATHCVRIVPPCADSHPSIGTALEHAADGDTILVGPGVHVEALNVDKAVTIRSAAGRDQTTIKTPPAGNNPSGFMVVVEMNAPGAVLRGFTILSAPGEIHHLVAVASDGVVVAQNRLLDGTIGVAVGNTSGVTVRDNEITGGTTGVYLSAGARSVTVAGNWIHALSAGVNVAEPNVDLFLVERNRFEATNRGVDVGPGTTGTLTARRNCFAGNAEFAIFNDPANPAVQAPENFWNHPSGPVGAGGSGNPVSANVDVTGPLPACERQPAGTVVVVRETAAGGLWESTSTGTARGRFTVGPFMPPVGLGGFRQNVGPNGADVHRLHTSAHAGQRLGSLTALRYSTYVTKTNDGQAPYLRMTVDLDGNGSADETLFFEPVYQSGGYGGGPVPNQCPDTPRCVAPGEWQTWDALAGGWWTLSSGTSGPPLVTLASVVATNPNAAIVSLGVQSGGAASWPNVDASVDALTVGDVTYDFEPPSVLVDCDQAADDIAAVQNAVNVALPGGTVRLKGLCDFSAALPHEGDQASIEAAAVVLRPGAPAEGLTIESDGSPLSATVSATGTQTAFFVAPGSENVTIRGLKLVGFARPIVVANARNVTVGVPGAITPNPGGNEIVGDALMNSGVLAVAEGAPNATVRYGRLGEKTATFSTAGRPLAGLQVDGNRIVYRPMGVPTADTAVTGVDVRQRAGGVAQGVRVRNNAIGFVANDFPSFDQNALRVMAHDADATPRIVDVTVAGNNVGWLEILSENAEQGTAGGRVGVFVRGAHGVAVTDNVVRAHVTPTPVAQPGAGVLLADVVGDDALPALVTGNRVEVIPDPSAPGADLGAVGLVDDALTLVGQNGASLPTRGVVVADNNVDLSHRGLVLNGAGHSTLTRNVVATSQGPALSIGVTAQGSSGGAPMTLRPVVTEAVACVNTFDNGEVDRGGDVQVDAASASTGNAFPGGQLAAGNIACQPRISVDRGNVGAGQSLTASGPAWAVRPVEVLLTGGGALRHDVTSTSAARYTTTYSPAELEPMATTLFVRGTVRDDLPSGLEMSTPLLTVRKDLDAPPVPVIVFPAEGQIIYDTAVPISGTAEPNAIVTVREGGVQVAQTSAGPDGVWTAPATLTPGTRTIVADARDAAGNSSGASAPRTFVIDVSAPSPPTVAFEDGGDGEMTLQDATETYLHGTRPVSSAVDIRISDGSAATQDVQAAVPAGDGPWRVGPLDLSMLALGRLTASTVAVRPQSVSPAVTATTRLVPNPGAPGVAPRVDIVDGDGIVSPPVEDVSKVEVQVSNAHGAALSMRLTISGDGPAQTISLDGDPGTPGIQPLAPDQMVSVTVDLSAFADGKVTATATATAGGPAGTDATLLDRIGPSSAFDERPLPVCLVVPVLGFSTCELSGATTDATTGVRYVYVTGSREGGGTFAMTAKLAKRDALTTTWSLSREDLSSLAPGTWTFRASGTDVGANPETAPKTQQLVVL